MPTFYTGMPSCRSSTSRRKAPTIPLQDPFFSRWVSLGLFLLSWHLFPKSLALLVLDHPIVLQPLAMEGYTCTPSSRMCASIYVHLILLPAYERVTDLVFFLHAVVVELFFSSCTGVWVLCAKNHLEIVMRHVTRTHHKDRYLYSYLVVNHLISFYIRLDAFGHVMQKYASRSSKKHFSVEMCVATYFQQLLICLFFHKPHTGPFQGP